MIKTLQKKIIITAMTAITVLLLVFIFGINIANYVVIDQQSDRVLERVTRDEGMFFMRERPAPSEEVFPFKPVSNDMVMAARYFIVKFDRDGEIINTHIGRISSVNEEKANTLAKEVYEEGDDEGSKENFKYKLTTASDGVVSVIFMDNSMNMTMLTFVLVISMLLGTLCWLLMLLLVIILSKKAILPIARNMEKQKQFVTNAGHEIKTPLAIIHSNAEALELYEGESKWSKNIRTQVVRLTALMENLLTLAKTEETAENIPMSNFCVGTLVSESLEAFRTVASEKNVDISTDIEIPANVYANYSNMEQVVSILCDNAVKYTPDGGKVEISVKKETRCVAIKIKNTFDQEANEDPEKFFERFYRGDSARTQKNGGYGIGLSAARAIAEINHATISAKYENNMIVFTVKINV